MENKVTIDKEYYDLIVKNLKESDNLGLLNNLKNNIQKNKNDNNVKEIIKNENPIIDEILGQEYFVEILDNQNAIFHLKLKISYKQKNF